MRSTTNPTPMYAGQCLRRTHSSAPARNPFEGHRMVMPPERQLLRLSSEVVVERKASRIASVASACRDGRCPSFSSILITWAAIESQRTLQDIDRKTSVPEKHVISLNRNRHKKS